MARETNIGCMSSFLFMLFPLSELSRVVKLADLIKRCKHVSMQCMHPNDFISFLFVVKTFLPSLGSFYHDRHTDHLAAQARRVLHYHYECKCYSSHVHNYVSREARKRLYRLHQCYYSDYFSCSS